MKSAAFNLAFKVHRNEVPFAEGLLKSNEEQAAEDFLDALNSLAGEIKYDPSQLPALLEQARGGGEQQAAAPAVDLKALQEEIDALRKKKADLDEGIRTLEGICAQREQTVLPGLNSIMLLITCSVFVTLLFIFQQVILGLLLIVLGLAGAGLIYMKDMRTLRSQQEEIARRRAKHESEIKKLRKIRDETEEVLHKKEEEFKAARSGQPVPSAPPE